MPHVECRVEAFEFGAGVAGGELPVDFGLKFVALGLPGVDFAGEFVLVVDAAVEALAGEDVEFDFGDVQPAAVLGGVDELEAVPQGLGLLRGEGRVERSGRVAVEVVHDQGDGLGVGVLLADVLQEVGPVKFGPALGHPGVAPAGERFAGHEHHAGAAPLVLVIEALRAPGASWQGLARLANQLPGGLVHAHDRRRGIVGAAVNVEDPLHVGDELRVGGRRDHPPDLLPRLELVFFSPRRTVSCDTLSMYASSTALSAKSLSDHWA